ncbi:MAG: hypothetical protein JW833_00390, partial [Prolixibacteraceae bacterium]|nr:hypothetical protein [Prolixibacteraceae bacterium]
IVGFRTRLDSSLTEVAEIFYIDTITSIENIKKALLSDTLTVSYTNGTKGKVKNMFDFKEILNQQSDSNN